MGFTFLKVFLGLVLITGGVQKLPCIQMGFSHDCCFVEMGSSVSNPSEKCCDSKTDNGFPILGASLLFQMGNIPTFAIVDTIRPHSFISLVMPLNNEHWGGHYFIPSYLEHAALLL